MWMMKYKIAVLHDRISENIVLKERKKDTIAAITNTPS